ncbi:hypothetical protein [Pseudomonas sp. N040]|uniref:hypothetical protein n=1 Tax=Pseudomonas sp. N040 TaxID=2785325 RepID=UPI0018A319F3|nr:hypothetical protein [Pseudomonas sp. N040]MBF7731258.1 hypothetical protein [Pseudomonas sp. N040]MBW7014901.1 hypothetical protein [Pseudomonas sp. N040]
MLISFIKERGPWLAAVVLVLGLTSVLQASVSYTVNYGLLHGIAQGTFEPIMLISVVQISLLVLMAGLWLLRLKRVLFRCITLSNSILTLSLLAQTYTLALILTGIHRNGIDELLVDVALIATINILIFSIWYWIIDPPGVEDDQDLDKPWDFLFPQRGSAIPYYQSWTPHYTDYLFVAFTTSFAFSPTDVMPLTKRAKLLMMLQSSISIVTLTGLAGSAINILASSA